MKETFKQEILNLVDGETIESIVIDSSPINFEDPSSLSNKPLKWEDVKRELDYEYDSGYGSQECHDIILWTKTRIIQVGEYDGATHLYSTPRNPKDYKKEE